MKLTYTIFNARFLNKIMNPLINLFPRFYERCLSGIIPCSAVIYILKVVKNENKIQEKIKYCKEMEDKTRTIDMLEFIKNV